MSKDDEPKRPGKVPGPVRVKPNKRSDLTDFRRAKRLQDYINSKMPTYTEILRSYLLYGCYPPPHSDR